MEKLLSLLKSLKFLEALSYVVAMVLYAFFPEHAVTEAVLLGLVLSVLKMFGITPELRLREFMNRNTPVKSKSKK